MRYIPQTVNFWKQLHIYFDQGVLTELRAQPNSAVFSDPTYAEKFLKQVSEVFKHEQALTGIYGVYVERIYKLSSIENEFYFLASTEYHSLFEFKAIVSPDIKSNAEFESKKPDKISQKTGRPDFLEEASLTRSNIGIAYDRIEEKINEYNKSTAQENFLTPVPHRPVPFKSNSAAIITKVDSKEILSVLEQRFAIEPGTLEQLQERVLLEKKQTDDLYFKVINEETAPVEKLIAELQHLRATSSESERLTSFFRRSARGINDLLDSWDAALRDFHIEMEKPVGIKRHIQKTETMVFQRIQEANYGNSVEITRYINELLLEAFYSAAYSYQQRLWRDTDFRLPMLEHLKDRMRVDEIEEVKSDSDSDNEEVNQENEVSIQMPLLVQDQLNIKNEEVQQEINEFVQVSALEQNHDLDNKISNARRAAMADRILAKFGSILQDNGFGYLQLRNNIDTTLNIVKFKRTYLDPILKECQNFRSLAWKKIAFSIAKLTFAIEEGKNIPILSIENKYKKRNFVFSPLILQLADSHQFIFAKEDVIALTKKRTALQLPQASSDPEKPEDYSVRVFDSTETIESRLSENLEAFFLAIAKNRVKVEKIKKGFMNKIHEVNIIQKWPLISHLVPHLKIPRILFRERETFLADCQRVLGELPNITLKDDFAKILRDIKNELLAMDEFFINEEKISKALLTINDKESDGVLLLGQLLDYARSNIKIPVGHLEKVALLADKYVDYVYATMQRLYIKWFDLENLAHLISKIKLLMPLHIKLEAELLRCKELPAMQTISIDAIEFVRDAASQNLKAFKETLAEIESIRKSNEGSASEALREFALIVSTLPNFQPHTGFTSLDEQLDSKLRSCLNLSSLSFLINENEKQCATQFIAHIMLNALMSFDYWATCAESNRITVVLKDKQYVIPKEVAELFDVFRQNKNHFDKISVLREIQNKLNSFHKARGFEFRVVQKFSYIESLSLERENIGFEDALNFLHMLTDSNVLKSDEITPVNVGVFDKVKFRELEQEKAIAPQESNSLAPRIFRMFGSSPQNSSVSLSSSPRTKDLDQEPVLSGDITDLTVSSIRKRKKKAGVTKRIVVIADASPEEVRPTLSSNSST